MKNWVKALAKAAPEDPLSGMSNRFNEILIKIPKTANMFNCFMLPLAVNKVPKIQLQETAIKEIINHPKVSLECNSEEPFISYLQ